MFTLQAVTLAWIWPIICELCSNRCPVGPLIAAWIPAVSQLVATQRTILSPLSQFEQNIHIGRKITGKCFFQQKKPLTFAFQWQILARNDWRPTIIRDSIIIVYRGWRWSGHGWWHPCRYFEQWPCESCFCLFLLQKYIPICWWFLKKLM